LTPGSGTGIYRFAARAILMARVCFAHLRRRLFVASPVGFPGSPEEQRKGRSTQPFKPLECC
jgi:hypothetical protein